MANEQDATTAIANWADELRLIRQKCTELTAAIEQLPWTSPAGRDSAIANHHLSRRMAEIVLALNEAKRLTDRFWQ